MRPLLNQERTRHQERNERDGVPVRHKPVEAEPVELELAEVEPVVGDAFLQA